MPAFLWQGLHGRRTETKASPRYNQNACIGVGATLRCMAAPLSRHSRQGLIARRICMTDLTPASPAASSVHSAARLVRLAKMAVSNLARLGSAWLIVLIVPPLLVRLLDRPAYATWMLVLQLGAYASLFDGGLQLAVGRYVARAEHRNDQAYLGEVVSSAAALFTIVAAVVCIAMVILASQLGRFFHSIPAPILPQATKALLLIGGTLGLAFPFSAIAGFYLGLEKNQVNAVAGSVSKIVGSAGTVWAAAHRQGLVAMALWTALGTMVQPVVFLVMGIRVRLYVLLRISLVRMCTLLDFGRFCSTMIVSQLGLLLISGLDLPIVAAFDFRNLGYYALAATVGNMLVVPHGAILSTLIPMMSSMSLDEQADRMGRLLVRTTRFATILLTLIAVPLMAGMPLLLRLWVGPDYARHTLLFGELLVAAQLIRMTLMPYAVMGFSAGEQGRMLISPAAESLVNLASSLILVRYMGAAGVALGTMIGALVGIAFHFLNSMPRTKSMAFSRIDLLWLGILRPISWAAGPAVLLACLLPLIQSVPLKVLFLLAVLLTMFVLFWKRELQVEDRMAIRHLQLRLLPRGMRSEQAEV
jgi:O-antigen/teichoic acid export membrane protein